MKVGLALTFMKVATAPPEREAIIASTSVTNESSQAMRSEQKLSYSDGWPSAIICYRHRMQREQVADVRSPKSSLLHRGIDTASERSKRQLVTTRYVGAAAPGRPSTSIGIVRSATKSNLF